MSFSDDVLFLQHVLDVLPDNTYVRLSPRAEVKINAWDDVVRRAQDLVQSAARALLTDFALNP